MLLQVYEQRWLGEMLGWQSAGRPIQTFTHHPLRIFEKTMRKEGSINKSVFETKN